MSDDINNHLADLVKDIDRVRKVWGDATLELERKPNLTEDQLKNKLCDISNALDDLYNEIRGYKFHMKKKPIIAPKPTDDVIRVQTAVADAYGYTREQMLAPGREEPRITARQMAIVLCAQLFFMTERELKVAFNYADDHAIHHTLHTFANKIRGDRRAKTNLATLRAWAEKEFPKAKEMVA